MLVDQSPERSVILNQALSDAGYDVVARFNNSEDMNRRVAEVQPDLIIIDMDSPDRDTIENMRHVTNDNPKPIVMFANKTDSDTIQRAVKAGVSAYIVDGLNAERVQPIMEVAIARFREFQALRNELLDTQSKLADRKIIEKAKGLLMDKHKLSESDAYNAMRQMAMNQNKSMSEVAKSVAVMLEAIS